MQKIHVLLIFFLFTSFISESQQHESTNYCNPLGITPVLSSNFGELRPNHFHMGIDFKTEGKIGFNLYSVEEGFVSRIKVSPYGYGKVIYIDHPNGVTSVYAHCSEFKGAIDSIVRATQNREQNFEVEVFPKKNEIHVSRGEIIGISGNTGSSTAPHLHFELRDTKTEHALNPLIYGFDLPDHKKPEIRGVKVYSLSKNGYRYPDLSIKRTVTTGKTGYSIAENKISVPASYLTESGGLGFSFDVIDRLDGAANQCGLYGSILLVNGDTLFGQQTDRVPFESTRYVNCHTDYEEYSANKKKFHKSFRTRENDLPIYLGNTLGILKAKPGETYKIHFIAFDPKGNRSELSFDLVVQNGELNKDERLIPNLSYLQPSQPLLVEQGNTSVEFGITTVYEPLKINQEKIGWSIGQRETPVHKAYRINIKNSEKQDGKHYLEMITANGSRKALKINYEDGMITCESMYFGSYSLKRDTVAPSIASVNFTQTSTSYSGKLMQWKISDSGIGLADYDLFIDGQWKLLEYEYKTGMVTYTRETAMIGEKDILVRVTDDCGNVKEWRTRLAFK